MTRIFTDTYGNVIPDVEYRLSPTAVIRVLLDKGVLTDRDVFAASDGRIIEVVDPVTTVEPASTDPTANDDHT